MLSQQAFRNHHSLPISQVGYNNHILTAETQKKSFANKENSCNGKYLDVLFLFSDFGKQLLRLAGRSWSLITPHKNTQRINT